MNNKIIRQVFGFLMFLTCVAGTVGCNFYAEKMNQPSIALLLVFGFAGAYTLISGE